MTEEDMSKVSFEYWVHFWHSYFKKMEGKNKKKKTKIINENVESNGTYFIQEIHERTENRYSVMNGIKKKNFSMFILTWSEKKNDQI